MKPNGVENLGWRPEHRPHVRHIGVEWSWHRTEQGNDYNSLRNNIKDVWEENDILKDEKRFHSKVKEK